MSVISKSMSPTPFSPATQQAQRQAIYAGLKSILTEAEANTALEKWSSYFNETGSVFNGLNNFAREICISFDKNDRQRELVRALNRALIIQDKPEAAISTALDENKKTLKTAIISSVATAELSENSAPTTHIDLPINTPDFSTFKILFIHIINLIEKNNEQAGVAFKPFLAELIESMPWSEAQQMQMTVLVDSGSTVQVRSYRPDQLKAFLSHIRTWMADEMGIADAIRIFNQAVKNTEKMPVAVDYSAKNFV